MSIKICRLCVDSHSNGIDIFNNTSEIENINVKIYKLFSFRVTPNDTSTTICLACIHHINEFYNFYLKVINAQLNFSRENIGDENIVISPDKNTQSTTLIHDALEYLTDYQNYDKQELPQRVPIEQKNIFKDLNNIIKEEDCTPNCDLIDNDCLNSEALLEHNIPVVFTGDHIKSDIEEYQNEKFHSFPSGDVMDADLAFDSDDNLLTYKRNKLFINSKHERKQRRKLRQANKLEKTAIKKRKSDRRKQNAEKIKSLFNNDVVDNSLLNTQDDKTSPKFPPEIIKDGKLIIKGNLLDELISKFYQIQCELCSSAPKFRNITRLMKHFDVVHETKGFLTCCNTRLYHHRTIYMHMARHLQPSAFECPICKKVVSRPHSLKLHLQTHLPESEKPHKCDECDRRFSYIEGLASHKLTHIPVEERETINCKICGKRFTLAASFSTHMRAVHSGAKYLCSECGRSFQRKTELTFHMLTHDTTGKNKVQCQQCGFMCKNPPTLKIHMKRHAVERLHCSLCEYSTHRQQQLNMHTRVKHSDDKPYVCVVCGKQFKLKSVLRTHMAQHTGEHKFMCTFCPKTFASPGNYHSHRKRMHADEHKNEIDMKQKERFKNIERTESTDHLKEDEEHVHELAREYLKKIADQNASKKVILN